MAPPCWPPRPPLMQLSEMPSYTSFLPATLPLGKFLLQDPAQGSHTPESISWLLSPWGEWGAHLCAPITSGDKLHPSAHHAALRAHVCYSHYVIIFACSSSQWFIQLVLEKIPNSRSQKSCPNLKPKYTKNKAGISVIPITLIERLKENGECHWIQTEPSGYTHTNTHTHIGKVQRWKGRKQVGITVGQMCIKRKAVYWYFVCLFFSLVESQSFLLLAWNKVSFMISWAKMLCTFLCQNIRGRSTWRIAQY